MVKDMLFKDIYIEYGPGVYKFLLSLTGDENQAEELMQETFYRAFLNIDKFREECSLYTWLCSIGKNAWIKECRRQSRLSGNTEINEMPEYDFDSAETIIINREQAALISEAMKDVEPPYIDVFMLKVFGEKKLSDIAKDYGKSESWARVTYYRAKAKIKEKMEELSK